MYEHGTGLMPLVEQFEVLQMEPAILAAACGFRDSGCMKA